MSVFCCKWTNGVLREICRPDDVHGTNFLLDLGNVSTPEGIDVEREWEEDGDELHLTINLRNVAEENIALDKLIFPIQANSQYVKEQEITYFQRVMQHGAVCGHGSFFYWCRPSGEGPYLAMFATDDTCLVEEINAENYAVRAKEVTLAPGEEKKYTFTLLWIEDHQAIQQALYDHGAVAVESFPGLVIPSDLELRLRLRCRLPITKVECENAQITQEPDGVYRMKFTGVGERDVKIHYGAGLMTWVKCYATDPVEDLIASRARHIAEKQQYRGSEWYDGLMSQWHAIQRRMTTPEDRMGLYMYIVCADDPGLCKAPYLAEKNVARPVESEIEAIEYYIEHFVWGKLQRTDQEEPYPYGIYGSDNWKLNRESGTGYECGGIGMERMWRTFDYTHLIQLYFNMYLIAKNYPQYVRYLDAAGYLERARRTALAFFEVPYSIYMRDYWSHWGYSDWAFKQGNFHERYLLPLLEACQDEKLRYYWETKCKFMIYDHKLPYGSEMWFDTTAFESTQAVAHYAMEHGLPADVDGWYDKNMYGPGQGGFRSHSVIDPAKHEDFLYRQMKANIAARGTQMRHYAMQGSDFRAGGYKTYLLSYMSQMGGAAVLDYALYFDENPARTLRAGYASMLSSWSLVNLGERDPWYPHKDNEGAAGWAFQLEDGGKTFPGFTCAYGPWPVDGEIDSGLSGAICASCSVLADDPDFGLVCYGGEVMQDGETMIIIPRDGVRRAFHALHELPRRLHFSIDRDAIEKIFLCSGEEDIWLRLVCQNITGDAHTMNLVINGTNHEIFVPAQQEYTIAISKKEAATCV